MFYVCQLVMGQTQPEGINTTGQKKKSAFKGHNEEYI